MLILNILFYVIAVMLLLSSLVVILAKNPMTSILALVFAFINSSVLFILLYAEFIAMVMLIIYVGAIAVLFIFIIMLLQIPKVEKRKVLTKNFFFGAIIGIAILVEILLLIKSGVAQLPNLYNLELYKDMNNSYNLGLYLYNNYYSLIIILGILLTVVVIGIIYICYEEYSVNISKQNMYKQTQRDAKSSVKVIKVDNEKGIDS